MRRPALLLLDVLAILVFAAIGVRTHEGTSAVLSVLEVASPFLLGGVIGGVVVRSWRDPLAWRSGLGAWIGAVVVGMALRAAVLDRLPWSFVLVASTATAVLLLGWRGVARGVLALRRRAGETPSSRRDADVRA